MNFKNPYNKLYKKKHGIFYTPEDTASIMSQKTKIFDDGKGVWLDPCCGLGILAITLSSLQEDPVFFITNRLIINEKDPVQLEIALNNFRDKFGVVPKSYNEDFLTYDFEADFIIMNPPYFKYGDNDMYAYFLDKASLTTKGFISINPMSFTNGVKFKSTRKNLLKYKSIRLYHFDNIPGHIFYDAIIKVSIIVVNNEISERKTTGQLRWKPQDRELMLNTIDDKLDDGIFVEDIFYKTNPNTTQYIHNETSLKDYIVNKSDYPIYVTNSPRYFITASTEKLDRKGQIKIYMRDLDSYHKALIMLNSSYLYWWCRISDSSLSLTKKTLLSLPWVDFYYTLDLIDKIKISELTNKVYKKNGGELQENVKHPKSLIKELNSLFLSEDFINLHD